MTEPATGQPVVPERRDDGTDGPTTGGERAVLGHFLERARETVLLKIAGLDAVQLASRPVPPSTLSLVGIVRHLTKVEAHWLRVVMLDEQGVPDFWCTPGSPDGDFDDVDPATAAADIATYEAELTTTPANAAAWIDLDIPVRGLRHGQQVNLRWILTHLVEEYARHLGHIDLLREAVGGRTGG